MGRIVCKLYFIHDVHGGHVIYILSRFELVVIYTWDRYLLAVHRMFILRKWIQDTYQKD